MLYVDGWMGLGWMVIIGHRSSKSTFGANKALETVCTHSIIENSTILNKTNKSQ